MRATWHVTILAAVLSFSLGALACKDGGGGGAPDAALAADAAQSPDAASQADAEVAADAASPDAGFVCDPPATSSQVYQFEAMSLSETRVVSLCEYRGEALLIVNIAALCGYTPQLATLAQLQTTYGPQGFRVLGFYSDQFGEQAGDDDQRATCESNYGVNFTTFAIVDVNGPDAHPLFIWLKAEDGTGAISWNFEKFLIARDGTFLERWRSTVTPDSAAITSAIEAALAN